MEYQYESGVVLNELLAPLVVPNRNVPKSIGTWAGMTFQNDRIIEQGILAKCKSGGKWGILGADGKELIAPAYKEILDVNDRTGVIHVMVDKKTTRFISKTGEQLTPEAADESDRRSRTAGSIMTATAIRPLKKKGNTVSKTAWGRWSSRRGIRMCLPSSVKTVLS